MRRFIQLDVFSPRPSAGNPLLVVLDTDHLTDEQMADFSRWTNLSEVTYLTTPTQPGADYAVRIFSGRQELPFAGHPTLGTAFAWLRTYGNGIVNGTVVQECGAGLVTVKVEGDRLAFAAPPRTQTGPLSAADLAAACAFVGITPADVVDHEWGANGPQWAMLQLADDAAVRAVRPTGTSDPGFWVGLVGLAATDGQYAYEVRGIFANPTVTEDPVTGSLNASVAQWLRAKGQVPASYTAIQGSQVGAAGEIEVTDDGTDIWIGGQVRTVMEGALYV